MKPFFSDSVSNWSRMDGSGGSFDFDDMFNSSPQIKTESPETFNLGQSPNQGTVYVQEVVTHFI